MKSDNFVNVYGLILGLVFSAACLPLMLHAQSITVSQPSTGQVYHRGDEVPITWTDTYNGDLLKVGIDVYKDGVYYTTLVSRYPNEGSFTWPLGNNATFSGTGYFQILVYEAEVDDGGGSGGGGGGGGGEPPPVELQAQESATTSQTTTATTNNTSVPHDFSGRFDIFPDQLNFTSDYSGQSREAGAPIDLYWSSNIDRGDLNLDYNTGSGWQNFETLTDHTKTFYRWYPSLTLQGDIGIRIRSTVYSLSDQMNNINLYRYIDVTSPDGNENLRDGDQLQVRWNDNLAGQYVAITLHPTGSGSSQAMAGQTSNDGVFNWTIPSSISTSDYYVTVSEVGGNTTDSSPSFTITKSYLNLTTSGNREIPTGVDFDIDWSDNISSGSFTLDYWDGGSWQPIATVANDETSHSWRPPASLDGVQTQIRIRSTAYSHIEDIISGLEVEYIPPFVDLRDPASGDNYTQGQLLTVRFATNLDPVEIDLVRMDGQVTTIDNSFDTQPSTPSDPNFNTKTWTIPSAVADGQYRVQVKGTGVDEWSEFFGIGNGVARQVMAYEDYDPSGNLLKATDANGQVVEYFYGDDSAPFTQGEYNGVDGVYLTGIRKVKGSPDFIGALGVRPSGDDLYTEARYDSLGKLAQIIDENSLSTRFGYDGLGRLYSLWNSANELVSSYEYEYTGSGFSTSNPNYIRTTAFDGTGPDRVATQYIDGLGRPIQTHQQVDSYDIVVATSYDDQGRPHQSYKPYRQPNSAHGYRPNFDTEAGSWYDGSGGGRPAGNGIPYAEQQYEASPLSRPAKSIPAGGEPAEGAVTTGYRIDSWGGANYRVTTTTDEAGNQTETWTDGWGRTVKTVADPGGINAETTFEYDLLDRLTKVTAPNDTETTYAYDMRGQLISKTSDDAGTVQYQYDGAGNMRFAQDANRAAAAAFTYTSYDPLGRPIREGVAREDFGSADANIDNPFESNQDYLRGLWAYDAAPNTGTYPWNQFASLIDGENPTNTNGQLTASAWRFGGLETTQDSTVQGLWLTSGSQSIQAADSISVYNSDIDDGASLTLTSGRIIRLGPGFHAKAGSQLTAAIDPSLATTAGAGASAIAGANPWQVSLHSYDSEGRLADKWIWTGDRRDWDTHLAYDYNRQGEITKRMISVAGQTLWQHYYYNQRGLLEEVYVSTGTDDQIDPATEAAEVAYSYTATGAIANINYKGSKDASYGYTIRDWVASINDTGSPGGNFAADYNYTDNGNVDAAEYHNPLVQSGGGANTHSWAFGYDGLNRLTGADFGDDDVAGPFDVRDLAYDAAGNIDSLKRWDETGSLIDDLEYTYTDNRLTKLDDYSGVSLGWDASDVASFGYDDNGNLTSQSGKLTGVVYEHRNLPVQFALATDDTVIANYNAYGQRILKETDSGAWSFYVMDGPQTLAVIKGGTLSHINLVGNSTFGRIDADTTGTLTNARRYYITDHLGSTRAVVDNNGQVLETFDYYPFGLLMPKRNTASANTLEKFTGKELDEETNLFHFGARAYDAALGKWLSVDPLAEKYPSISPYVYAANNPMLILDPDGREIKIYYDCNDKGEECSEFSFNGDNAEEGRDLDNELVNQFLDAYTYVTDNVEGTDLQEAAESREHVFGLRKGEVGNRGEATDYFDKYAGREYKGTIYWNPLRATEYESGVVGPPALGLAHEAGHAMEWARYAVGRTASEREQYATFVEEQKVARGLGLIGPNQVTRSSHSDGESIIVRSPVSTTLDRKATYNYYLRLNAAGRNVKQYLKKYGNGN